MSKIKLFVTLFLISACPSLFAQSGTNLPFLEKVYAINCDSPEHDIAYFIHTEKYGVVSLYPEGNTSKRSLSITGSAWGYFYRQQGEVTTFQKNGFIENRAIWVRGNQLALVHSNGQFRDNQKFYKLCAANSAASRLALSGNTLNESFSRFAQFEDRMQENKKSSECSTFRAARQSCAAAGSYEKCMSIRWGDDWAAKEVRCK
jgi:hypothetical protein